MDKVNGSGQRESFQSSFGLIAAAIGSAVGLGNIWRFPYITGINGGGAFLIIYLFFVAIIGIPIMLAEFIIGREAKKDAIGSYKALSPNGRWYISGILGVLAAFFILAFYSVVAGWTLEYLYSSIINKFQGQSVEAIGNGFETFISNPIRPIFWQLVVMLITSYVVANGIEKGIEKYSKVLIPLLFALVIILDIRAITLPGGRAGLEFLFKPNFSELKAKGILDALGHSFFSLSLGMGIMVTYGSYIREEENLKNTVFKIAASDTLVALLAGIAIFPAVFSFGISPGDGPGLVFITLPNVFLQMPGGYIFSILFFALLALAAFTSTISLLEAVTAHVIEKFNMERKRATMVTSILIFLVGVIASLSNGPVLSHRLIRGMNIFDFLDYLTANYFLTASAFISSIFVGWSLDKRIVENQLTNDGRIQIKYVKTVSFILRFIAPIAILIVFLTGIGIIKL